ncbi:MAG: HAD family hydrolase [Treponema sp.]|nr:HAD family hydrolase [Treponema sp.]MBD5413388.1 HAD family hydrolase [Treponema sp.]MDE6244311.1 HAD family hydrolase [Treponemataceae bacterium]
MKYKLLIFDMDGTILNTLEDIATSTNYALKVHRFPERTREEIRAFVGNGTFLLIERACPAGTDEKTIRAVYETFTPHYNEHCSERTKPYSGIIKAIETIRSMGIKTAVLSNKPDAAVKELCKKWFPNLFDYEIGSRPNVPNKPAPDSVNEIISRLSLKKDEVAYIGDSDVDVETASNANIDCIGVEWGFRGREFLLQHGAKVTVKNAEELLEYFKTENA